MPHLIINTEENELLTGKGIPFFIDYPALRTSMVVTLHLEGTMSYTVQEDHPHAPAEPSVLAADVCASLSIALSDAEERIGHPSRIPDYAEELSAAIRERLAGRWKENYGALPGTLVITKVNLTPDDQALLMRLDKAEDFAGKPKEEQISSMEEKLRSAQREAANSIRMQTETWKCTCGAVNKGNFCTDCGKSRVWICVCSTVNAGNFCTECGKPRV